MPVLPGPPTRSILPPTAGPGPAPAPPRDFGIGRLLTELRDDHPVQVGVAHHSHHARFLEVLGALGRLAAGGDQIEAILEAACGVIAETLAVDGALVAETTGAPGRLEIRAGAGCLAGLAGQELSCGADTQAGFALEQPGATASADARAAWPRDPFLGRNRVTASVLVALPGPDRPLGLLCACETERRAFEPDELGFVQVAAAFLATALARLRAGRERERLEARVLAADGLASLGSLAGGVAHDLNNPLSYVNANLAFIAEEAAALVGRLETSGSTEGGLAESARQVRDAAADTRDGVEAMRGLVRDLQTLSQGDAGPLRALDPTKVLESSLNLAQGELRRRVRIERSLAAALPPVRASEARLGQVFLGLLVQAARAVPAGLTEERVLQVRSGLVPGDGVAVEVQDAACELTAEQVERCFDPPSGASPGLGSCRSVVEALGGELSVERRPGQGTTYRVRLPAAPAESAEPRAAAPAPAPSPAAPRRPRILVVDDEPMVGNVLTRSLGSEYEVVVADGARAALDLLAGGQTFDLCFCDLLMPGMTGMDLYGEVQRVHPALARNMVFLTGGAFTSAARDFLGRPGVEYLEKPFDLAAVRGAVTRHLAGR